MNHEHDNSPRKIELLAPAKDPACGRAAILCGADAVYIGAERFGARAQAGNSVQEIEKLARLAHRYRVRIYATVNTIFTDAELGNACALIHRLYNSGVDAIIVQDMGLLECDLPPIPLFASTQAHNNSSDKVLFLEKAGFQRVILARELTLDQIREIRRRTTIELECFVHGALCVCYSGQCYLSYAIGGRSANRGECAQPCRKTYSLEDNQHRTITSGKHLLSLKDLNRSDDLLALISAGISSFKIEGRLKDESYVKNIVGFYRKRLDSILECTGLEKSSSGKVSLGFDPDPDKAFNRGYTSYYLHGKHTQAASIDSPKFLGIQAGQATPAGYRRIRVDGGPEFSSGDGIAYYDPDGVLRGTLVNRVEGQILHLAGPVGFAVGTDIFRNCDYQFEGRLLSSNTERLIPISITVKEENSSLKVTVRDDEGSEIMLDENIACCERARNPEKARDVIRTQLGKLGGTEFIAESISVDISAPPFLTVSRWNGFRRRLIGDLARLRECNYTRLQAAVTPNDYPYPTSKLDYRANVLNARTRAFYKRHQAVVLEPAAESGIELHGKSVMTTPYCLRLQNGLCPKENDSQGPANPLWLVDDRGVRHLLVFDCAACEMQIIFDPGEDLLHAP